MKMAKATEQDMASAMLLLGILEDVSEGHYPRRMDGEELGEDDPVHFRPDQEEHLRAFYERMMDCVKHPPSGVGRVIWGMDTIMHNNVLDPNVSHLEIHPRLDCNDLLAAAKETLSAIHEIQKAFGTPGDYGYDHPEGKALVRLYTSTQALSKEIKEKEPVKQEPTVAGDTGCER